MPNAWKSQQLPDNPSYISPSGVTEIRTLPSFVEGEIVHARLPGGHPSTAARLNGCGEIFYILSGEGELWRRTGPVEAVTQLRPGRCVTLPPGIDFQYRATSERMDFLVATAPRWQRSNWAEAERRYWQEDGTVGTPPQSAVGPWLTVDLPERYDYLAPDGSEIRLLTTYDGGGLAHCRLPAGHVSAAVRHRTVVEIWYETDGRGEIWRSDGTNHEIISVMAGTSITIPVGTLFQFRTEGNSPLEIVIGTFPRWPGASEAEPVTGHW